jgi:TaqI-like C-terminal specificity domain
MQTGRNDIFGGLSSRNVEELHLPLKMLKKRATNSDILRYQIVDRGEFLIYVEDLQDFSECPPAVVRYLEGHRSELKQRAAYRRGDCLWWKFTWPLHKEWYAQPKILCPFLAERNRFALDTDNEFLGLTDTTVLFKKEDTEEDLKYILGLLNSKLLTFRFFGIGKLKSKGIYEYFWNSISRLPVRRIDFTDAQDKIRHAKVVALVDKMLKLNKRKQSGKLAPSETDRIDRELRSTDREIDDLVYDLYNVHETSAELLLRMK